MPKHELKYKPVSALDSLEKGRDFIFSALTSHYRIMGEVDAHISLIQKELLLIESLKAQLKREMGCVDFYASGSRYGDLEPKPGKTHLYDRDYPMYSDEWNQRSMSDHWSGKFARETVKARGIVSTVIR